MEKVLCKCGCGEFREKYDKRGRLKSFIFGHQQLKKQTETSKLKNKLSHLGKKATEKTKKLMRIKHLGIKKSESTRNKLSISNFRYGSKVFYRTQARKIMELYLSRKLTKEETVHHLDFNYKNNNINNLYLFSNESEHQKYHFSLRKMVYEELSLRIDNNQKNNLCIGGF